MIDSKLTVSYLPQTLHGMQLVFSSEELLGTKIYLQLSCLPATSSGLHGNLILTVKIILAVFQALVFPPLPFPLVHSVQGKVGTWLFAHTAVRA